MMSSKVSIRRWVSAALVMGLIFSLSACSVFGIRTTDETPYQVLQKEGDFELRRYQAVMAVSTFVKAETFEDATDVAFRRLFKYITGDNQEAADIAMTAPVVAANSTPGAGQSINMTSPVVASEQDSGWTMQFVLPASFTASTAPPPTNPSVELIEWPEQTLATLRYSGLWDSETFEEKSVALESWVANQGYESVSIPRYAGFDPPWTLPFLRRNEVQIEVEVK